MKEVRPRVFEVGAKDPHRKLFDEFMPLPWGTSYNSYLVKGSVKTALIDTVDPGFTDALLRNVTGERIDFIISNHAEQDHSGSIPAVLNAHPQCKVVTNSQCKNLLISHLHIPDDTFILVNDGETLSLGDKTLQFILTPWVHWPETMCTYLKEDKIIFTCDLFGAHYAHFDLFVKDEKTIYDAAKRYYAEIMMPFRAAVKTNMQKISAFPFDIIAPSHGPVYDHPQFILDAYADWTSDAVKREVLIVYVSMHGSTHVLADHLSSRLTNHGFDVKKVNLTEANVGELAIDMVDASAIIVGSPKFLTGLHPTVEQFLYFMNVIHPKTRFLGFFGSLGWGTKVEFQEKLPNLQCEFLTPLLVKGLPRKEDLAKIDAIAAEILKKV